MNTENTNTQTSLTEEGNDQVNEVTTNENEVKQKSSSFSFFGFLTFILAIVGVSGNGYLYWLWQNNLIAPSNGVVQQNVINEDNQELYQKVIDLSSVVDDLRQQNIAGDAQDNNALQDELTKLQVIPSEILKLKADLSVLSVLPNQIFSIESRVNAFPSQQDLDQQKQVVLQIQKQQHLLENNLDEALNANRQKWRIVEADHLIRLASLRLSALKDVASAEALVEAAADILKEQNDPLSYSAREQVYRSLQELRNTTKIDREGIFLSIAALRESIKTLTPIESLTQYMGNAEIMHILDLDEEQKQSWVGQFINGVSNYIKIDVNADDSIKPLISGQTLQQVRLALSLSLEQAQWATLHANEKTYLSSLADAKSILANYFNKEQTASRAVISQIDSLEKLQVYTDVPDLTETVHAIQLYVARKQKQDVELGQSITNGLPQIKENVTNKALDDNNGAQQ